MFNKGIKLLTSLLINVQFSTFLFNVLMLCQISYKFSQISIKMKLKHCFFVAKMTVQITKCTI